MFASNPPVGEALRQTVLPDAINFATITTIVGGTGAVISVVPELTVFSIKELRVLKTLMLYQRCNQGILVVGLMRYILFLAIWAKLRA